MKKALTLLFLLVFSAAASASTYIVFPPSQQGLVSDYEYFELVKAVDNAALSVMGSNAIRPAELIPLFVKMGLIKTDLKTFKILSQSELGLTLLEPDEASLKRLRIVRPGEEVLREIARSYEARYGVFVSVRVSEAGERKKSLTGGVRSIVFGRPDTTKYDALMRAVVFGAAGLAVSPMAALPLSAYAAYSAVSEESSQAVESESVLVLIDLVKMEPVRSRRFKVRAGSREELLKAFSVALSEELESLLTASREMPKSLSVSKEIRGRSSHLEREVDPREVDDVFPSFNVGHGTRPGFRTSF